MTHRRDIACAAGTLVLVTSVLAIMTMPAGGQQPSSPVASASQETKRYPEGRRLQGQYETVNQPMSVPEAQPSLRAATTGFAAATKIQANLPEGFTLLAAPTSHIGAPQASLTGAAPAAAAPGGSANEKFITVFPLAYKGIPLSKGSDYLSVASGDGRLLVTRKRGLPGKVDATQASNTAREAVTAAQQSAGQAFANVDLNSVKAELQIWVDDQQNGNLSWTFTLASGSAAVPDVRRYWVSAVGQPRVLNWESEVYHTQHGLVSGNLWATTPAQPTANRPLAHLEVKRSTDMTTQVTGPDGRYGFTTTSGSAEIRAKLRGPFFVIDNKSGAAMEDAKTGTGDNPIDLNFGATTEDQLAQISAFYWANVARDLAHNILSPTDLAALPVRTNINATCNAFWDGSSINFFKSAPGPGGCPNTAYSDVVMHEYGHGIDAAKGGILDGGYSEGFGDSIAVLATRQACVGRDFFGPGTCLRPASDVILWPFPAGEEVHAQGRRYAGFVWELIQQLKQSYSDNEAFDIAARLVLGAAAANPHNIPDAVRLSFVVDDTDGDLTNGTPHFRALAAAADSRHIPRPPDPLVGGVSVSAAASFPWAPAKVVTANSNILQATVHLDKPGKLHISADTSARSATPVSFATGVYNTADVNTVWTNSYRNVSVPVANQWSSFGTMVSWDLPAGDHTIYWKIWITGGSLTLSSGTLLLEAFEAAGGPMAVSLVETATTPSAALAAAAAAEPKIVTSTDRAGRGITVISP